MFSLKTSVFFFSCIAIAVANPAFFNIVQRKPDREAERPDDGQPYRDANAPFNQQAGTSSVFSEVDDNAAGGDSSNSAEDGGAGSLGGDDVDDEADGELEGSEGDTPDSPDTGSAVVAGGAQQGGNSAGDTSSTPSPNVLGGGPGLIVNSGKGSSAGQKFGIAFAVLTVVGLAAGGAFYAYRKRREASYGSRF